MAANKRARLRAWVYRNLSFPVRCAWCNRLLRRGNPALPTSHGICKDCERKW